jgi:hypothetical protein
MQCIVFLYRRKYPRNLCLLPLSMDPTGQLLQSLASSFNPSTPMAMTLVSLSLHLHPTCTASYSSGANEHTPEAAATWEDGSRQDPGDLHADAKLHHDRGQDRLLVRW